ncbi:MAG: hypothetical protein JWN03_8962 [Nocardia sp.]|uniref:nucleotidyl transferase AbiEii/AbiGii toxin family protein n=1 Tax=Nocardia sp. TaxID=1821 RepID=UPI00261F7161|nr:nucleotidyl transferase AbiEii/AbiGii toxin family protein [Nocardia sp.]MCU1648687.1 hypothetical protein [Nocardia sp.]
MTIDLSSSTDPEICLVATALAVLIPLLAEREIDFLVVGASARNITSIGILGRTPDRATRDVDIAIAVDGWEQVRQLGAVLSPINGSCHRFDVCGIQVDVIPCGPIENANRIVNWPNSFAMNTLGFQEAFSCAEKVQLPDRLVVRIPSIAAQALLKLVAWSDRHWDDRKDAIDLATMLDWYNMGRHLDLLYEEYIDLLVRYDYDTVLASAHRLGYDMADPLDDAARDGVRSLFNDPSRLERLANDMNGAFDRQFMRVSAMFRGVCDEST